MRLLTIDDLKKGTEFTLHNEATDTTPAQTVKVTLGGAVMGLVIYYTDVDGVSEHHVTSVEHFLETVNDRIRRAGGFTESQRN